MGFFASSALMRPTTFPTVWLAHAYGQGKATADRPSTVTAQIIKIASSVSSFKGLYCVCTLEFSIGQFRTPPTSSINLLPIPYMSPALEAVEALKDDHENAREVCRVTRCRRHLATADATFRHEFPRLWLKSATFSKLDAVLA